MPVVLMHFYIIFIAKQKEQKQFMKEYQYHPSFKFNKKQLP